MARRANRLTVLGAALALAGLAGGVFWYADRGAPQPEDDGARHASTQAEPTAGPETAPESRDKTLPEGRDDFVAAFRAGLRNFRAGDAHGAARAFEKAVALRPHEPQARVNLGFAYLLMGRAAEAETLFVRATEIAPMAANAYYGLAESMEARGDLEGALGAMRTFLHLAPEDDPFRRKAAAALWEWEETLGNRPEETPALAATAEPVEAPALPATGVPLLDAPLETFAGAPVTLAAHAGRIAVVNVWATWCGPCRVELPSLARLSQALDPDRFAVIGVSMDAERALPHEYLDDLGIGFTSYWDGTGRLTRELLDARVIPLTLVLSPEGRVLARHEGALDWSAPEVVAAIRALAEQAAPIDARIARLAEALR